MLQNIVELLGGLFLSSVILLIGLCTTGSIVAALRAVSEGSLKSTSSQKGLVDRGSNPPQAFPDAEAKVLSANSALKGPGLGESPIWFRKREHVSLARKKKTA